MVASEVRVERVQGTVAEWVTDEQRSLRRSGLRCALQTGAQVPAALLPTARHREDAGAGGSRDGAVTRNALMRRLVPAWYGSQVALRVVRRRRVECVQGAVQCGVRWCGDSDDLAVVRKLPQFAAH